VTARAVAVAVVQLTSIAVVSLVAGLVFWATVPAVLGWRSHAVLSGSMAPAVAVGDVLSSSPVAPTDLRPGMVVVFRDPTNPAVVLSHRIRAIATDGTLATQGDANLVDDPFEVTASDLLGVARLRVPAIGLPRVWWTEGRWELLAAGFGGVAAAALVAAWPDRRPEVTGADVPEPVPV
jgi:signal peptidase I